MSPEEQAALDAALIEVIHKLTKAHRLPWRRDVVERLSDFPEKMDEHGNLPRYPCFTVEIQVTGGMLEQTDLAAIRVGGPPTFEYLQKHSLKLYEQGYKIDFRFYDESNEDHWEDNIVIDVPLDVLADIEREIREEEELATKIDGMIFKRED